MQLYLIRHPTPDIGKGICYGRSDIGLTANFEAEFAALAGKLAHVSASKLYSSPSRRCQLLADRLAHSLQLPAPALDERLMELDFGDWELQSWDELPREYFDVWSQDYINLAPPNGETFAQLHARAVAALHDLRQVGGETALVVTHGGIIRCLLAEVLGLPLTHTFRFQLDFASVTQLLVEPAGLRVGYVNR